MYVDVTSYRHRDVRYDQPSQQHRVQYVHQHFITPVESAKLILIHNKHLAQSRDKKYMLTLEIITPPILSPLHLQTSKN